MWPWSSGLGGLPASIMAWSSLWQQPWPNRWKDFLGGVSQYLSTQSLIPSPLKSFNIKIAFLTLPSSLRLCFRAHKCASVPLKHQRKIGLRQNGRGLNLDIIHAAAVFNQLACLNKGKTKVPPRTEHEGTDGVILWPAEVCVWVLATVNNPSATAHLTMWASAPQYRTLTDDEVMWSYFVIVWRLSWHCVVMKSETVKVFDTKSLKNNNNKEKNTNCTEMNLRQGLRLSLRVFVGVLCCLSLNINCKKNC